MDAKRKRITTVGMNQSRSVRLRALKLISRFVPTRWSCSLNKLHIKERAESRRTSNLPTELRQEPFDALEAHGRPQERHDVPGAIWSLMEGSEGGVQTGAEASALAPALGSGRRLIKVRVTSGEKRRLPTAGDVPPTAPSTERMSSGEASGRNTASAPGGGDTSDSDYDSVSERPSEVRRANIENFKMQIEALTDEIREDSLKSMRKTGLDRQFVSIKVVKERKRNKSPSPGHSHSKSSGVRSKVGGMRALLASERVRNVSQSSSKAKPRQRRQSSMRQLLQSSRRASAGSKARRISDASMADRSRGSSINSTQAEHRRGSGGGSPPRKHSDKQSSSEQTSPNRSRQSSTCVLRRNRRSLFSRPASRKQSETKPGADLKTSPEGKAQASLDPSFQNPLVAIGSLRKVDSAPAPVDKVPARKLSVKSTVTPRPKLRRTSSFKLRPKGRTRHASLSEKETSTDDEASGLGSKSNLLHQAGRTVWLENIKNQREERRNKDDGSSASGNALDLSEPVPVYKHHYQQHSTVKCLLSMSENRRKVVWRRRWALLSTAIDCKNVIGFIVGPKSRRFRQLLATVKNFSFRYNPWRCCSVVLLNRTVDLTFKKENQMLEWIIAAQRHCPNVMFSWKRNSIIRQIGWMKLRHAIKTKGMRKLVTQFRRATRSLYTEQVRLTRSVWASSEFNIAESDRSSLGTIVQMAGRNASTRAPFSAKSDAKLSSSAVDVKRPVARHLELSDPVKKRKQEGNPLAVSPNSLTKTPRRVLRRASSAMTLSHPSLGLRMGALDSSERVAL